MSLNLQILNKKNIKNMIVPQMNFNLENNNEISTDTSTWLISKKRTFLIKLLIKETLYNSIAQAILRIIQSHHIVLRLFLLVCVVLTSALSSYLVIESVMSYFRYDVITTSRSVFEMPTLFPKVTICNQNPFTTEKALHFLKEMNKLVNSSINIFDTDQMALLDYSSKKSLYLEVYNKATSAILSRNFTDERRKELGHTLDEILIMCEFNGQACSSSDFTWKFDRYLGNCFVFNADSSNETSSRLKRSYIADSQFGLSMDIFVNFHENLTQLNAYNSKHGAYIRFENSSYLVDDTVDNGITLMPGVATSCSLGRVKRINLAKPYSMCDLDNDSPPKSNFSEFVNLIARSKYEYNQQLCFYQCLQKSSISACNCTHPYYLSLFEEGPHCVSAEQTACFSKVIGKFVADSFIADKCLPFCPLECNLTEFRVLVSTTDLLGDSYADFIRERGYLTRNFVTRPIDVRMAKESVVRVHVFYNTLSYTLLYEYSKITIVTLLGSIGGNLSLFMGVSVFSLFELVEVAIEIYFIRKKTQT